MGSIFKKELNQFFSNLTGYIAIILFLLINAVFLFILQDSSIFEFGYASLDKFFELAPWILMFLVPAITMRSLSDEFRAGTFEILKTKPLSAWQIVLGKYYSILVVLLLAILPTIIYIVTIKALSNGGRIEWDELLTFNSLIFTFVAFVVIMVIGFFIGKRKKAQTGLLISCVLLLVLIIIRILSVIYGNIDTGGILGSYIGLFLLAAVFAAIGLCCSGFTNNAVVAFLISAFGCLILYFGFNALSKLPFFANGLDYYIEMLGIDFHYRSISRGVLDSRDLVYFLSVIFIFLLATVKNLHKK